MAKLRWYSSGDFSKSKKWLRKLHSKKFQNYLMNCAEKGIQALSEATPKASGYTAESWYADVEIDATTARIYWKNSHYEISAKDKKPYPIAILIDIGHGTGTGGYVKPTPYIDAALEPIMLELSEQIRKEVFS